jgi:tetratricopeptide (TPR) repeat protein
VEGGIRTAAEEFVIALDHIEEREYGLALPILSRLVAFEPDNHGIYEAWIEAHLGLGRYARVIEIADAGIAAGRPRAPLEFWKAFAYAEQEDVARAEAAARAAIAAEPAYAAAIAFLGALLVRQNRHAEALELCQRAAAEHPDDESLALQAVGVAEEMELHQLVIDSAHAYLKRFGKQADVLASLANAYVELKDYRKADRAFRDAAALEPDVADHHFNVVMAAIMAGNEAAADAYLDRLARRDADLADEVAETVDRFFEQLAEEQQVPDERP